MNQASLKRGAPSLALIVGALLCPMPLRTVHAQASYAAGLTSVIADRRIPQPATVRCTLTSRPNTEIEWDGDSDDAAEDSIDAQVLAPGSGMVAVDSHGRLITAGDAGPRSAKVLPAEVPDCCPMRDGASGPRASDGSAGYTTSSGRDLERCEDSMKPPPSKTSPL